MNITLLPGQRNGKVKIPASKSQAHRLLICAALGTREVSLICDGISKDIAATMNCLNALGASIHETSPGTISVKPIDTVPSGLCHLHCGESGSTLRFLLPVVGALGANAVFHMEGRLPQRPLEPLDSELRHWGMSIRKEADLLYCSGKLLPCRITIPGNISSQYISGLLMAMPLLSGDSTLTVTGKKESISYITMTEDALSMGQIICDKDGDCYRIPGNQRYSLPEVLQVEGDFSNAAFFLCAGALSDEGITVEGLNPESSQGDKAVLELLNTFGADVSCSGSAVTVKRGSLSGQIIDAAPIPDLIPVLSVVASVSRGETHVVNAARLRLKESDRLLSTTRMLKALGADIQELSDGLIIRGVDTLDGGTVDSFEDHRIAMSAAVAACVCGNPVNILGSQCVEKSYPEFWTDFSALKGENI